MLFYSIPGLLLTLFYIVMVFKIAPLYNYLISWYGGGTEGDAGAIFIFIYLVVNGLLHFVLYLPAMYKLRKSTSRSQIIYTKVYFDVLTVIIILPFLAPSVFIGSFARTLVVLLVVALLLATGWRMILKRVVELNFL